MFIRTALAMLIVTACLGCSAHEFKMPPCLPREGRCFDLQVNGQPAAELSDRQKLKSYERAGDYSRNADLSYTKWQVAAPIRGPLSVIAGFNALSADWLGNKVRPEVMILPLDGQELRAATGGAAAAGVRAEGREILTLQRTLEDDTLPPGAYLLTVTLWGEKNWDRKHVFITVE